jgi:hypothetical protein
VRFVAIIYFNGPLTTFTRAAVDWKFEEWPGGVRLPLAREDGKIMPPPNEVEVLQTKPFRSQLIAMCWLYMRLRDFDHSKLVGEVRPQ